MSHNDITMAVCLTNLCGCSREAVDGQYISRCSFCVLMLYEERSKGRHCEGCLRKQG
jgi:hypothetical protein